MPNVPMSTSLRIRARANPRSRLSFYAWVEIDSEDGDFRSIDDVVACRKDKRFKQLEEVSDLPFLARWIAEWLWLQSNFPRPFSTSPTYFTDGRRDVTGQFDVGQRELYVSAFLRCLAFGMWAWNVPREVAEDAADAACLLNRGLADVIPTKRPDWSYNTHKYAVAPFTLEAATKLIKEAISDCPKNQTLMDLRLAEDEDTYCYKIRVQAIVSSMGAPIAIRDIPEAEGQVIMNKTGFFGGRLLPRSSKGVARLAPLSGIVWPTVFGRLHTDLLTKIVLPYEEIFSNPVGVVCHARSIEMEVNSVSVAKWEHWYARWRPVCQADIGSTICTRTLADKEILDAFLQRNGEALGYLVTAKIGRRDYNYATFQFESENLYVPA